MKDWWLNLSLREKQTLAFGGLIISLLLLYQLIWSPWMHKLASLKTQVKHARELLTWLQQADQQLQTVTHPPQINNSHTMESTLSILQDTLKKSPFAQQVAQLRQAENDTVQVTLQKVSFDWLIKLLLDLWEQNNLIVSQINVTPTNIPGEVTADVMLQRTK